MNCEEVRAWIETLHDGEDGPQVAGRVEAHVSTCASCRAASERLSALSAVLRRSAAPAPSAELDERLKRAFRRKYGSTATPGPAWWRRLFAGSVSIPKPAFAAAMVAAAAILTGAYMLGRVTSSPGGEAAGLPATRPAASAAAPPEVLVQTRLVEVPVVREKIVTRTVYVERVGQRGKERLGVPTSSKTAGAADLALHDSVGENGYVTLANLKGFEPAGEMKARVIRNGVRDEK